MIQHRTVRALLASTFIAAAATAVAMHPDSNPFDAQPGWGDLPGGRMWGSTSAIYPAPDGQSIWVGERCGANTCVDRPDLDPILHFDLEGRLLGSFGAGLIVWPHGLFVDDEGNVWVADARGDGERGHQVWKFSPEGEVLMTLGTKGVAGEGDYVFDQPSDVYVAPDGSIFVADGHGRGNNNRIVKYDAEGTYLMEWGGTGGEDGQFRDPHALAMDSEGRLYVGDRANNRIQVFTQDGEHLDTWHQFGRPSGIFIDENDVIYVVDSESNRTWGNNPGFKRGMRIGDIADAVVDHFIPDPFPGDPSAPGVSTTFAEGVAVDAQGNVYGAEVGPEQVVKYTPR
ncbi:MAG: peptidyl-alpha-hydroxyglycine alpha-amidating lyase family protein [Pseudomonadales bacterium]|jgi:DNA-binding beta-propeller fold protein YncE|nr:peptidyl-alpha-hydroxyglycine alpha-amidating lyase family protein [Pseudomonadales bacterium]